MDSTPTRLRRATAAPYGSPDANQTACVHTLASFSTRESHQCPGFVRLLHVLTGRLVLRQKEERGKSHGTTTTASNYVRTNRVVLYCLLRYLRHHRSSSISPPDLPAIPSLTSSSVGGVCASYSARSIFQISTLSFDLSGVSLCLLDRF